MPDAALPIDAPSPVIDAPGAADAHVAIDAPHMTVDASTAIDAPSGHPDARPRPDAPPPIDAPSGGCTTMELLGNGDFDSTTGSAGTGDVMPAPWFEEPGTNQELIYSADDLSQVVNAPAPQSGDYTSWMGDDGTTDILYQMITVPAGTTTLTLTGYVDIFASPSDNDFLTFNLFDAADSSAPPLETLNEYTDSDGTSDWQQFSFTASQGYAGQMLVITVQSDTDIDTPASFFVDTLSLQATVCP